MSASEFTCICLGMLFNVATFFLGTAVGFQIARSRQGDNAGR